MIYKDNAFVTINSGSRAVCFYRKWYNKETIKKLETVEKWIDTLNARIGELVDDKIRLMDENRALTQGRDFVQNQLDGSQKEVSRLKNDNERMRDEIVSLNKQIEDIAMRRAGSPY